MIDNDLNKAVNGYFKACAVEEADPTIGHWINSKTSARQSGSTRQSRSARHKVRGEKLIWARRLGRPALMCGRNLSSTVSSGKRRMHCDLSIFQRLPYERYLAELGCSGVLFSTSMGQRRPRDARCQPEFAGVTLNTRMGLLAHRRTQGRYPIKFHLLCVSTIKPQMGCKVCAEK